PGADTETVMVSSGRPWVRFKDSAERDRTRPEVLLNWKSDTCQTEDCCTPMARAWTWNSGVVPLPRTGVRGVTSSRIAASDGESAAKLRLSAQEVVRIDYRPESEGIEPIEIIRGHFDL